MDFNLCRDLCWLGARNNLWESSLLSIKVARCTSVSAVSHIMSLTGSFGSILSRCCRIDKKGISCGVSCTLMYTVENTSRWHDKSTS